MTIISARRSKDGSGSNNGGRSGGGITRIFGVHRLCPLGGAPWSDPHPSLLVVSTFGHRISCWGPRPLRPLRTSQRVQLWDPMRSRLTAGRRFSRARSTLPAGASPSRPNHPLSDPANACSPAGSRSRGMGRASGSSLLDSFGQPRPNAPQWHPDQPRCRILLRDIPAKPSTPTVVPLAADFERYWLQHPHKRMALSPLQ